MKNTRDGFFLLARRTNVLYISYMEITTRQKEVLSFIRSFQDREGFPPSLREICKGLALASAGSLLKHMRVLEKGGYLTGVSGKKRAWKLTSRLPSVSIPLVGQIAAGTPILAQENREDDLPIDPRLFGSDSVFALRVQGDSMIDAQIRDGDLAIIRPQETVQNGGIAAVQVEGLEPEATLKVVRRRNMGIELHAANPAYEPLVFTGDNQARVRILGRLVGVIRAEIAGRTFL